MKNIILSTLFLLTGCASLPYQTSTQTRQEYVAAHPELSQAIKDNILAQKFEKGMTKEQIIAALGKPGEITTVNEPNGKVEMWTYYGRNHLYFYGDKLSHWYQIN